MSFQDPQGNYWHRDESGHWFRWDGTQWVAQPTAPPGEAAPPFPPPAPSPSSANPIGQPWPPAQPGVGVAGPGALPSYPMGATTNVLPPSGLAFPQGVELATVGRRIGAWFLAIPLAIVTLGIGYLIWGLVIWGRGQTPALQVLGMRCWRPETQRAAGWWWMALREIVGGLVENVLGLITLLVSFALMLTSQDRKCLHDMIAGTVVVHDPHKLLQR